MGHHTLESKRSFSFITHETLRDVATSQPPINVTMIVKFSQVKGIPLIPYKYNVNSLPGS